MNKTLLIGCAIFLTALNINGQNVSKIRIVSVPLYLSSPFRISCGEFINAFNEFKKAVVLTDEKEIEDISEYLTLFQSQKLEGIDVRGVLILCYKAKKRKSICFDEFGHFWLDGKVYENKVLFNYLLEKEYISY